MEPDVTKELGEDEPTTDANYREGWDSTPTGDELFDQIQAATEEAMNRRPTKTLSDDR
jgi:hypothetical protein